MLLNVHCPTNIFVRQLPPNSPGGPRCVHSIGWGGPASPGGGNMGVHLFFCDFGVEVSCALLLLSESLDITA